MSVLLAGVVKVKFPWRNISKFSTDPNLGTVHDTSETYSIARTACNHFRFCLLADACSRWRSLDSIIGRNIARRTRIPAFVADDARRGICNRRTDISNRRPPLLRALDLYRRDFTPRRRAARWRSAAGDVCLDRYSCPVSESCCHSCSCGAADALITCARGRRIGCGPLRTIQQHR